MPFYLSGEDATEGVRMDTEEKAVATLEAAGFTAAATLAKAKIALKRRLAMAYEHFRYVTEEQVKAFNAKLHAATKRKPGSGETMTNGARMYLSAFTMVVEVADQLTFTPVEQYAGIPPKEVLAKVGEAKALEVFDGFTIAAINPVATQTVPYDPIVFGLVHGCTDRFFIAEWGQDVKLADIIGPNEG